MEFHKWRVPRRVWLLSTLDFRTRGGPTTVVSRIYYLKINHKSYCECSSSRICWVIYFLHYPLGQGPNRSKCHIRCWLALQSQVPHPHPTHTPLPNIIFSRFSTTSTVIALCIFQSPCHLPIIKTSCGLRYLLTITFNCLPIHMQSPTKSILRKGAAITLLYESVMN